MQLIYFRPPIDSGDKCSHFVLVGHDADDDGQLHTLALLERLRSEANLVRGASDGLYERVDKLLRHIGRAA